MAWVKGHYSKGKHPKLHPACAWASSEQSVFILFWFLKIHRLFFRTSDYPQYSGFYIQKVTEVISLCKNDRNTLKFSHSAYNAQADLTIVNAQAGIKFHYLQIMWAPFSRAVAQVKKISAFLSHIHTHSKLHINPLNNIFPFKLIFFFAFIISQALKFSSIHIYKPINAGIPIQGKLENCRCRSDAANVAYDQDQYCLPWILECSNNIINLTPLKLEMDLPRGLGIRIHSS